MRFVRHRHAVHCIILYYYHTCTASDRSLGYTVYASKPETEPHRTQPVEILRLRRAVVIDREHASGEASCY